MENTAPIFPLTCKRCGAVWYPRTSVKPQTCAKCKTPYWETERVRIMDSPKAKFRG